MTVSFVRYAVIVDGHEVVDQFDELENARAYRDARHPGASVMKMTCEEIDPPVATTRS